MLYSLALGNSSVKTAGKLEIAGSRSRSKAGSKARQSKSIYLLRVIIPFKESLYSRIF